MGKKIRRKDAHGKSLTQRDAIELLKEYSPSEGIFEKVLGHVKAVQKVALRLAKKVPGADIEFIKTASLLHDIGRFKYPPRAPDMIRHGIEGARILRKLGYNEGYAKVCERHIGVGITKSDILIQKLPLPLKDYVPRTKEEKIISYADNLIFGKREGTIQEVIDRYTKELGPEYGERVKKQHEEIIGMMKKEK